MKLKTLSAVALVATLVLALPTPTIRAGFDYQPVARAELSRILTAATVKLVALGCDLSVRNGTAVAISAGRLLTNRHVVVRSRQVDAIPDVGAFSRGQTAVTNDGVDVATVATPGLRLQAIPLATSDPSPGAPVLLGGFPGSDPLVIGSGRVVDYVAGPSVGQSVPVMRLTAAVRPGMSGSPIVDGRGHLAGMLFGAESPSGYALALPASTLRTLLTTADAFVGSSC